MGDLMEETRESKKRIQLEGKVYDITFKGQKYISNDFVSVGINAEKKKKNILYRSWNLTFNKSAYASEVDNNGNDEVQIMFNLNQDIEWIVEHKKQEAPGNDFSIELEEVKMAQGEVCIFRNNDYKTSMSYQGGVNFKFKSLQLKTSFFRDLLSKYFPDKDIQDLEKQFMTKVTTTAITPEMYRVLSEIDTSERFKEYEDVYLEGKMIELISLVLFGIAYHKTGEVKRKTRTVQSDVEKIEALREQIQRFPSEEYDAPSVSSEMGMSVSKLNRVFRSLYDTSLHSYVQDKRLEKAAKLLEKDGLSVSEAAIKSGYTNLSHFSSAFSKKFGVLPRQFAK